MRSNWLDIVLGSALLLLFITTGRAAAQSPQAQARALDVEVRRHMNLQDFDRATLPLYLRAMRLDVRAANDTLLAKHSFYAGITYNGLERLDSATALLRQSMRLSAKVNKISLFTQAAGYLNAAYQKQGRPDSMGAVRARLEAIYPGTKPNSPARANLDDFLAGYYQDEGQYSRSMGYRLATLAYRRQRRDTANVGVALANVGELFYLQQQYRPALKYRAEALRWLRLDPSMRPVMAELLGMMGKTYRELGRLDSARQQYETALSLVPGADEADVSGMLHAELSSVLTQQGQLALARRHSRQALASYARSPDLDGRAQVYYFAGDLELQARNYPAARTYLRQAYALARQVQNKDRYDATTRRLAQAETGLGHFAEANRLNMELVALLDSAHAKAGQRAMAAMEARYQNRDKQQQIRLLNEENRVRAAEVTAQRQAKYLALAGVAGLLLVLGLIGFLLRQRQRIAALLARQNETLETLNQRLNGSNAQLAEANQTKAKLFSIVSHDLRAPVSNLFQLLELTQKAPHLLDEATRQQQTAHLRQTARDLLDTMEELLDWSKNQLDGLDPVPESLALAPMLAELAALYAPLAQRKDIALTTSCSPDLRHRTDPNFLRVILRNLVQNAIKFTPAGGVVGLSAEAGAGGSVALRVADTGPGLTAAELARLLGPEGCELPTTDPAHGLGLRLTREFVAKLGGTLTAGAAPGGGGLFTVALGT